MDNSRAFRWPTSGFLEGLDKKQRESILAAGTLRRFRANSVVAHQGQPADRLFMLVEGSARFFYTTQGGKKVIILWLTPGQIFGGRSLLLAPSTNLASTETVKESLVMIWRRRTMQGLAARYPRLLDNAVLIACDFLNIQLRRLVSSSHSARQRLLQVLSMLAPRIGREVSYGIELDVTNEELAHTANITPFTASRLLSELVREGTLKKRRGKVLLPSAYKLHADGTSKSPLV
jgi:CRP/FNR family transcriptional regulator, nitrogen oxide reductase regulator